MSILVKLSALRSLVAISDASSKLKHPYIYETTFAQHIVKMKTTFITFTANNHGQSDRTGMRIGHRRNEWAPTTMVPHIKICMQWQELGRCNLEGYPEGGFCFNILAWRNSILDREANDYSSWSQK